MNCPNCGGVLNLKEKHCDYCDTTFTDAELYPSEKAEGVEKTAVEEKPSAPERKKTLTEQRQEEIAREKANRPKADEGACSQEIVTGAAVMGCFSLFAGVRRFFRELKRTVCTVLLVALEIGFGCLMISGVLENVTDSDTAAFALLNAAILAHALIAGVICRIGRLRFGTVLVGIVNFLAVIWVFIYPLIETNFADVSAQYVAILAVIEMAVLTLGVLFTYLISKRR